MVAEVLCEWSTDRCCECRDRNGVEVYRMKTSRRTSSFAFAVSLCMLTPAVAQAAEVSVGSPNVRNSAGLILGVAPDYSGSQDYEFVFAPAALVHWGESERYVELAATELSVNLINDESWHAGPVLNYRFGRDDVEDDTVDRFRDIDDAVEGGFFVGWTKKNEVDKRYQFSITGTFLHDLSDTHDGFLAEVSMRYALPVAKRLTVSMGIGTTFASEDYNQTYYGVSTRDANRSGLPTFNAGSGFRDVQFSPRAVYSFTENWHLSGNVVVSRLLGDASDSPIVDDRGSSTQVFAGLGLSYAW